MVTYILTWLSACINPVIYCLTNRVCHVMMAMMVLMTVMLI